MSEVWARVPRYEGRYQVSDHGRVWSELTNRIMKIGHPKNSSYPGSGGYGVVGLSDGTRTRTHYVHLLVLRAFRGEPSDGQEALHCDGDRANARLDNLRWGTRSENMYDRVRHGNHHLANRTHCANGHKYTPENTAWKRSNGSRVCRECARASVRRSRVRMGRTPGGR